MNLARSFGKKEIWRNLMKIQRKAVVFALFVVLLMSSLMMENALAQGETAVVVKVGSRDYNAVFYDNRTVENLLTKLPLQIKMSELNGNEKYRYLDFSLPTNEQSVSQINAGDIMLYGSDCLVLFYKSFQTSYRYTRVGKILNPEGLESAVGSGSTEVTITAASVQETAPIQLTKNSLTLRSGQTKKIKLTGAPAKKVKWSSSNKKVATVSNGRITARKAGKAVITARYKGKKYKCSITVKAGKK